MAGGSVIGALRVLLGLDSAQFEDGAKRAKAKAEALKTVLHATGQGAISAGKGIGSAGLSLAKFGGLAASAGLAMGAMVVSAITPSIAEFENLNASLTTSMGSASLAADKFKELQGFAATTPFQLAEVVEGFNKLKNMGLDPSIRSMQAYGNMSGAMGKSMNDMVEAVADAATGEFERLKEFGIRAASEGDRVKFTFGGVTTEVGKNSAEIQKYLLELSESKFGGGMALQAQTLGGAMSNLTDGFQIFAARIGSAGVSGALKGVIVDISTATGGSMDFADAIGKVLGGAITSSWNAIKGFGAAIQPLVVAVSTFTREVFGSLTGNFEFSKSLDMIADVSAKMSVAILSSVGPAKQMWAQFTNVMDAAGKLGKMVFDFLAPTFVGIGATMTRIATGPIGQVLGPALVGLAKLAGGALVVGLKLAGEGFNLVLKKVEALILPIARAIQAVGEAGRKFSEFGRNAGQGLANGMASARGAVEAAGRGLGMAAQSGVTSQLQIKSPSRVFIGYGENISQGLAIGIRAGSSKAVDALRELTSALDGLFSKYATETETATNTFISEIGLADLALKNGKATLEQHAQLVERIAAAYGNVVAFKLPEDAGIKITEAPLGELNPAIGRGLVEAANDNIDPMKEAFRGAFSGGLHAAIDGNFSDFLRDKLKSAASNMFDRAINSLADFLFDAFKSTGGGSGGGGGLLASAGKAFMSIFSKGLPGFKNGGSFNVGGSGGVDSQLVAFMASPSERVDITKPGGNVARGGGVSYLTINSDFGAKQFVIDTARGTSMEVTGAALQGVKTAQSRKNTYSRYG
jgi:hypothetical protein